MRMFLLSLFVFITGCCTPEIVYVPVSSCTEPPSFNMPVLKVALLSNNASAQQSLEALANDHRQLKGSLKQCITILDGYRK